MIFTLLYMYIVHQQNNLSLNKQEKCMQRIKMVQFSKQHLEGNFRINLHE